MRIFRTPKGTEILISEIKGKEYLEVKWRIVWFREEHPTWSLMTEFLSVTDKDAFVKATIVDEKNCLMATAHKYEDKAGFPDYREKAETGAIGRALALIGYGTQFCADELDEGNRLADAPVERRPVVGTSTVRPGDPGPNDGVQGEEAGYRIDFGQWNKKSLEEIYRDPKIGPKKMKDYIQFLEDSAAKKKEKLGPKQEVFIQEAELFLGVMENSFGDGAA